VRFSCAISIKLIYLYHANSSIKIKDSSVRVTGADLNYIGSIDETLLEASNIIEGKVSIVNINNGERFETYAIKEKTLVK
jgi:aspartate 1-decarboxylase